MTSVLESFDPSFLNSLQANQIADLENALLPHLQGEEATTNGGSKNKEEDAATPTSTLSRDRDETEKDEVELQPTRPYGGPVSTPASSSSSSSRGEPSAASDTPPRESSRSSSGNGLLTLSYGEGVIRPATVAELSKAKDQVHSKRLSSTSSSRFSRLLPCGNQDLRAEPVIILGPLSKHNNKAAAFFVSPVEEGHPAEGDNNRSQSQRSESVRSEDFSVDDDDDDDDGPSSPPPPTSPLNIDNAAGASELQGSSDEIQVDFESVKKAKSLKFNIPGSSKHVTLKFTSDTLEEMRNGIEDNGTSPVRKQKAITSSSRNPLENVDLRKRDVETEEERRCPPLLRSTKASDRRRRRKKRESHKSRFGCNQCSKMFPSQKMLERHENYHVDINRSCSLCGKLFYKKWNLDEHMASEHGQGKSISCSECGKFFKWERNLLAHVQLHHQPEEVRHRCKYCPLTFLKKKSYINHHKSKHSEKQATWCKVINIYTFYISLVCTFLTIRINQT